ncbi:MAG: hypothetical protein AAF578_14830 [Pseudomonadota bacterium]
MKHHQFHSCRTISIGLLQACSLLLSPLSVAAVCDPFIEVESEYRTQLEEVVRELDEQSKESFAAVRNLLHQGGWDGRAESLQFDDAGRVEFDVTDDVRPMFEDAQAKAQRISTDRMIEVRRLQQIDFIHEALAAIETLAIDGHSAIEPFSVRADALEILGQALDRVGLGHLSESYNTGAVACDLSSAIRDRSIRRQKELKADPGFKSRIGEFTEFSRKYADEIENGTLTGELRKRYQSLQLSIEDDFQQIRAVHYLWLLAELNDMSVVIRDSNLVDADRFDADAKKLGLHIDEQREKGEIGSFAWEVGRHWILFNRKYSPNEYAYGEFSGWEQ